MAKKETSNIKKKFHFKIDDKVAFFLIFLFIVFFTFLSFGRHDSLKSYLNDLGVVDQMIWNTMHGSFFQITTSMYDENHYLGGHFSPILIIFVLFYAILSSPKWLLFFQVLAVGLSAIPIYLLAKEKLKIRWLALIFLFSYLVNPVIHNSLLYDFHEIVLATVFASFAFYFIEKRSDKWFVVASVLLSISQEHLSLLVFMMGLYLLFIKKRKKFGLAVSASALAYFLLVVLVFMPLFSSSGKPALLAGNNSVYPLRYAWLGKSIPEIIKNIFTDPLRILSVLFSPERIRYIIKLIIPVSSLALYSAPILIVVPLVLINLLSSNPMTFDIFFYHSAIFIPFIYFSAIDSFQKWFLESKKLNIIFAFLILLFSLGSFFVFSLSPGALRYSLSDYLPSSHAKKINEIKKIIPSEASLSVQHNLGPHFSERRKIYRFPQKMEETEFILLDTVNPYQESPDKIFNFSYALQIEQKDWNYMIENIKLSDQYEKIYDSGGYIIFKNKSPKI